MRQWTLPMICDHLAKSMIGSTGAFGPSAAPLPPPLARRIGRLLVLQLGFIPRGIKSSERIRPEPAIAWEPAIAHLDEAVMRCEQKSRTPDPWLPHPLIGFTDAATWQRFHLIHARHHFKSLRG